RKRSKKQLWLSFDEWNVWYRKNTEADMNGQRKEAPHLVEEVYNLEDALVVGGLIITLLRHSDRVRLACLAQLVNDIAPLVTNADGVLRQTIYYPYAWALKYGRGNALNLVVESETYEVPEIGRVPYVDIAGTFDPESGSTTLFVLNRDLIKAREVEVGHRRGAATKQMPARRRAPSGCGPQARWLCCSLLTYGLGIARRSRLASGPGGLQQNVKLFLREPLVLHFINTLTYFGLVL